MRYVSIILTALLALSGFIIFQFAGNSVQGYIQTHSLFTWWGSQWFLSGSEADHGPLILMLASVIFFWNCLRFVHIPAREAAGKGILLISLGLLLHLSGFIAMQTRLSILGFLSYLLGVLFLTAGERVGRAALFPLLLLLFSVPLGFLNDEVGFFLRLSVIRLSTVIMHSVGIDVIRDGSLLYAPDGSYTYDVEAACSGIRSLLALASLSLLIGYVAFRSFWRRVLLLLLSLPFAFLGNLARIICIILAAECFGQEAGTKVHDVFGYLIFILVLGMALLTVSLLERICPEGKTEHSEAGADEGTVTPRILLGRNAEAWVHIQGRRNLSLVVLAIFLSSLAFTFSLRVKDMLGEGACGVLLAENGCDPLALPGMLGDEWAGESVGVSEVERQTLPADTGFSRKNYLRFDNLRHTVFLSIVLSGLDRSSIHRPELCITGQGWRILSREDLELDMPCVENGRLPVTLLMLEKRLTRADGSSDVHKALTVYWFVSEDVHVASYWERMFRGVCDRLFRFKHDRWAYIVAQTPCPDGREAGLKRITEVLQMALPSVLKQGN